MEQPNWPTLWEREPGLRPEHAEPFNVERFKGDRVGRFAGLLWGDHPYTPAVAAALCRDAAVRWLATVGHQTLVIDCVGDDEWYVGAGFAGAAHGAVTMS